MSIKIFHLNTECNGKDKPGDTKHIGMLEDISRYINRNKFDLVGLQEVSGNFSFQDGNVVKRIGLDGFKYYQDYLKSLSGTFFKFCEISDIIESYWGVAVFYNPNRFELIDTERIYTCNLNQSRSSLFTDIANHAVGFLSAKLKEIGTNKIFYFITGHLSWGKIAHQDSEVQQRRAKILLDYIKLKKEPVITTVDMNVEWFTKTSMQFADAGLSSLALKYKLDNTLNPLRTRHFNDIFVNDPIAKKKGGVSCDNIFLTPGIKESNFKVVKEDLSDHYGLMVDVDMVS